MTTRVIATLPRERKGMSRLFGVEIEFHGSRYDASEAIRLAGVEIQDHGYQGHSNVHWVMKADASVQGGGEVVSPPLNFDDPLVREQVNTVVRALKSSGCSTTPMAGIHIHIDGHNMTAEQIGNLVRTFHRWEDVIMRIASSGWRTLRPRALQQYAKQIPMHKVNKIIKAKTTDQISNAWYDGYFGGDSHGHSSRFHALNLHSYFLRGTIEFRCFNSTLNAERLQGYIALCMALVQDAKNGFRRSLKLAVPLGATKSGLVPDADAPYKYMRTIMRTQAGLSKADAKILDKIWKDSQPQSP